MNINRDNYEMYFLMYVDNELSAAERTDVELFISMNPDLNEELEILSATTLNPEEHLFIPKTRLYKNATEAESVQESLLLHLDNELSAVDAEIVNSQISSNKVIEAEWSLLKQTKLGPEHVEFREKEILYRHSSNVISMRLWKVAAAILIGAAIFTGASLYNKDKQTNSVATNNNTGSKEVNTAGPKPAIDNTPLVAENPAAIDPSNNQERVTDPVIAVKNDDKSNNKKADEPLLKNINREESNQVVNKNVEDKEEQLQRERPDLKINTPEYIAEVRPDEKIKEVLPPVIDTEYPVAKESFAKLAENEEGTEDRILYMEEDKVTRSKLGGFFRKVKRVVERNAKINTSNGLRIGGFEIALK